MARSTWLRCLAHCLKFRRTCPAERPCGMPAPQRQEEAARSMTPGATRHSACRVCALPAKAWRHVVQLAGAGRQPAPAQRAAVLRGQGLLPLRRALPVSPSAASGSRLLQVLAPNSPGGVKAPGWRLQCRAGGAAGGSGGRGVLQAQRAGPCPSCARRTALSPWTACCRTWALWRAAATRGSPASICRRTSGPAGARRFRWPRCWAWASAAGATLVYSVRSSSSELDGASLAFAYEGGMV